MPRGQIVLGLSQIDAPGTEGPVKWRPGPIAAPQSGQAVCVLAERIHHVASRGIMAHRKTTELIWRRVQRHGIPVASAVRRLIQAAGSGGEQLFSGIRAARHGGVHGYVPALGLGLPRRTHLDELPRRAAVGALKKTSSSRGKHTACVQWIDYKLVKAQANKRTSRQSRPRHAAIGGLPDTDAVIADRVPLARACVDDLALPRDKRDRAHGHGKVAAGGGHRKPRKAIIEGLP